MDQGAAGFSDSAMLEALLAALESAKLGCSVVIAHPDRIELAYANEAYARMAGLDLPTAMERHPFTTLPPEEAARINEIRAAVRRGEMEAPSTIATRFVHEDGTMVPVELGFGHALLGDRRATFCFFRDTTEKTAMEAALRESEDRFRRLAEGSPDSIAIYVAERCVYANPRALSLLGIEEGHLDTFEPLELVRPEQREPLADYVERVKRGEKLAPFVNRRTMPNGEARDFEASLATATIGGAPAIVVYTRDITERTRLQAELMKQDRLASVGVLAAGVAHELNNPLAALSLLVEKLRLGVRSRVPHESLGEDLEKADDAVRRMSSIIGDLLFLARPAGNPHSHVDVGSVLMSTVALLRAGVPQCPVITEDIRPLPLVRGFPSKLGQAFLNVLRNAVQAVEGKRDGEVRVAAHAVGHEIVVTVADDGPGIPEDVLPRLMTPFFTTKETGTGLGLWISQGIMRDHGGRLELASAAGGGTTVTLALPA